MLSEERHGTLKVKKNSLQVAIFLAFLATAGLFYVNLGAAFLSAFVDGLGVSRAEAGFITSANKYGAAFGGLIGEIYGWQMNFITLFAFGFIVFL